MIRQASDEGVTEIIGFVLIMGMVAVVLFIMALVVPPMTGAEMEEELALDAVEDISGLKYDMDLLWEDSTLPNVTRSVLIQLSTPKLGIVSMLPVFTPTIGSATLTAGVSGISLDVGDKHYDNLLRLSYTTSNNYAPDSMVVYEAGAVFAGTRDFQSLVFAPSGGKSGDNSLLIVLPHLVEGSGTSVSGNRFGVVEYRLIDTNISDPDSQPEIKINIYGREDAAKSLYHAGGDALPLKNLVFYNTVLKDEADISLIKSGSAEAETSLDGEVWETGDRISFGENLLEVLSIVGLDSRNRPALLYLGADAVVLPVGDMVPDEWGGDTPIELKPIQNIPPDISPDEAIKHVEKFTFESINLKNGNTTYPLPENRTDIYLKMNDNSVDEVNITNSNYLQ